MKSIIFSIFLFCTLQAVSQEKWQNKVNSFSIHQGVVLQKADSNGWMVATNTKSFTTGETRSQFVLIRYDKCGKIRWTYRYGVDTASITMTDMITDQAGNIALTGYYSAPDDLIYAGKSFMMKLSSIGDLIWIKVFNNWGNEYIYSIGQTNDGAYFIFSNHDKLGGLMPYNGITKVSSTGNLIWHKRYADNPIWGSAIKTSDGGILIRSGNLIYKTNTNGNVVWSNSYENIRYTGKPIEAGNQYIFASYPASADSVCYLLSLKTDGTFNWISPSFKSSTIKSLKKLSNGNLLATATIQSTHTTSLKIGITEFTGNGTFIQQQIIDASTQQLATYGNDIIELDNHSLIYAGLERSGSHDNLLLLKSSEFTDFSCAQTNSSPILPQQQINITTAFVSSLDVPIDAFNPIVTKTAMNTEMTTNCLIPDNNSINLGNDVTLCQSQSLVLHAGLGTAYQYIWSNGATSESITVHQPGTYWVKAFICDTISDTIMVNYVTPLTLDYKISPLITNPYSPVRFENFTHGYTHLVWQTGDDHIYTTDFFLHQYINGGIYFPTLTITDQYGCVYSSQLKVIVNEVTFYIPNSFSPNGDGINDVFVPKYTGIENFIIYIYNRWGEQIFTTTNKGWDGKLRYTVEASQGVYAYKILIKDIFGKDSIRSGNFTLFR